MAAKADGVVFGIGQLKFIHKSEELAFDDMDGMEVYVIEARKYEESWLLILSYIRELETAPVWEREEHKP